eukprot:gene32205-41454_t
MALTNSSLEHLSPLLVKHAAMLDQDDNQLSQYLTKMISKENSDKVIVEEVGQEIPDKSSASIEVGDFVSLLECPTLTLEKAAAVDEAISLEKCLGDKSWGRVGIVVAKRDAKTSTVKELFSGHRADYVDEELAFADGSFPGLVEKPSSIKVGVSSVTCCHCTGLGDPLCGGTLYECQSPSCQK